MTDSRGTMTYTYDNLNRLVAKSEPSGSASGATTTLDYGYDANGRRTSMTVIDTVNGQTSWSNGVTYTYDLAGQLTGEADASGTAGFQYNSAGERTRMTQPNGEVTTYGHDAGGRLTSVQIAYGTGSQANYVYGYDPAGNRVSEVTPAGTYKYTYDALNRLSGALRAKIEETLDPR